MLLPRTNLGLILALLWILGAGSSGTAQPPSQTTPPANAAAAEDGAENASAEDTSAEDTVAGGPSGGTELPNSESQAKKDSQADSQAKDQRTLADWAEQLSHPRFLRRESAERHLIDGGEKAVPVLIEALGSGDLETTQRVISVLARIAQSEPPLHTEGAFAALSDIARRGVSTKSSVAKSTLQDLILQRQHEARVQLTAAGVFVDIDTVALGARSQDRPIVRIDENWNGDVQTLDWLRWLAEYDFAVLKGKSITPEVFEAIARMPDLETLVVIESELSAASIEALQQRTRLDAIEFRYIRLNEDILTALAEVRLRSAIYLMGTGVSTDRVEQLRAELPGLEITHRQGGFLGVVCRSVFDNVCEVSQILEDSAADKAGLRPGDIVTRIDGKTIARFEDLQNQINTRIPGDEISIQFRRGDEMIDTTATLGKQRNQ
ncbi:PDZ domain-containing protein [Roseiconus nitratireducens]|uniref:PDZ domain-containing protein n=1 Tax=Roseiconus nitratireducens TaxID=2605748 RepID=A0A5M6DFP9_9BACT|nr:PDZ domain-containing protein [Roseiconus nitratireducens]KAA5545170.1 PDZ domain-containing protein [Roseiconus nitratireducens]